MQPNQHSFVEFALQHQALLFGEFKLNSGRISPYFFNAGCFNTGAALAGLGRFYAAAIQASGLQFDMLFGPAYKGIPLVATTAIALAQQYNIDKPYAFNRKQAKDHGEGLLIVGAPLRGRVLVIDDVITSGMTITKVYQLIRDCGAEMAGMTILLDRQERGDTQLSAVAEVEKNYDIPVIKVSSIGHVLAHLQQQGDELRLQQMRRYREEYGVDD